MVAVIIQIDELIEMNVEQKYEERQELMHRLLDINRRLVSLTEEYENLHGRIAGEATAELDQAAKSTQENIKKLKENIITDYEKLDDELNGEPAA